MKALLALVMMLVLVYFATRIAQEPVTPDSLAVSDSSDSGAQADRGQFEIISVHCEQNGTKYKAEISLRNVSDSEVSRPRVFVQFNPKGRLPFVDSADILPASLPVNATGKASLVSRDNDGRSYDCTVLRIEDSSGVRVD